MFVRHLKRPKKKSCFQKVDQGMLPRPEPSASCCRKSPPGGHHNAKDIRKTSPGRLTPAWVIVRVSYLGRRSLQPLRLKLLAAILFLYYCMAAYGCCVDEVPRRHFNRALESHLKKYAENTENVERRAAGRKAYRTSTWAQLGERACHPAPLLPCFGFWE